MDLRVQFQHSESTFPTLIWPSNGPKNQDHLKFFLAAGDLNIVCDGTDDGPSAPMSRDGSVFDRMDALGLEFMGPEFPAGRQAHPTPGGLPPDTRNVPTYHTIRQSPETAQLQLDYAFASRGFHKSVKVRAMNSVEEWGASDHCRLLIEVARE